MVAALLYTVHGAVCCYRGWWEFSHLSQTLWPLQNDFSGLHIVPTVTLSSRVLLSLTMKQGSALTRPGLSTHSLLVQCCDQERGAVGAQRGPCLPLILSYQTHWPPRVTLNLPEKLTPVCCEWQPIWQQQYALKSQVKSLHCVPE